MGSTNYGAEGLNPRLVVADVASGAWNDKSIEVVDLSQCGQLTLGVNTKLHPHPALILVARVAEPLLRALSIVVKSYVRGERLVPVAV
jgi:hypothetical protein